MDETPLLLKVPAASVPYGEQIARHGYVWIACSRDCDHVVAVAASKNEARRRYREAYRRWRHKQHQAKLRSRESS
jgi:hypothetical protein